MIHLIYIYIIINAFVIGFLGGDGSLDDIPLLRRILAIFLGMFLVVPVVVSGFIFEYSKLWFNESWIGNIRYVYRYRRGKETVTAEAINIINQSMDKKLAKPRRSFSDKVYIWGVREINKTYLKNF